MTGRFFFGKPGIKGRMPEDVDPGYLRWVVDCVEDCNDEDRAIMRAVLARKGELDA